ncbi:MAG: fibronectin type III domain-containing protein, partial [Bacteroidales bacterium]|nr:fibronectin type III domain-containing protein [Bacteroidales bacterium]
MKTSFFQRLLRTIGSGWTLLLLLLSAAPVVAQHADSCLIGRNQLPYEENFNELSSGSTAMPCWRLFNHGRAQCYVYALAETDSTPYLMFTVYGANDTTVALLPKMEDSLGDLTIQFRVRNYYGQGFLMLGTADEANPFGSFRPITICRPAAAGLWTSYEFDLSAYSGFRERIAFMSQAAPYDWTFLDDVVVRRNSTCPRVMSLRVDSLSSDVLRLVWLDTARSGRYQVQLRGSMAGGGSEVDELVFDTMATFQNLLPNRQYTGRVRSLCADNDSSFWSEVVCMTPCTPMQGSLRETFDSTEVLPPCWQQYQLPGYNPAGNYPMLTTRYASSGTRSLLINSGSTYASYVVLPPMADSIHLLELRLKALRASSYYTGMLRVGVMTIADDTATFHPIDSICPQQAGVWQTIELSLDSYRGAQGRLALMGSTSDGNYVSMAVDDIELYRIPTCRRPLAAEVMAMTDSSVVMRLTPRRRGDRMHFVLSSEAHQQEVSTTDTLIVLSGLQPTTSYRWQLRTLCSTTDSSEDLCGQFTTPCAPVALPWSDHFDGYAVSDTAQLSVCWRKYHTPSFNEQSYPILSQEWSLSGSNALRFFAYGDEECYAVLPKSEVAYDSVMLTFDVLAADAGSQLWVVLLPAPNRIAEHRLLHRINLATANDWQHIEVPLTGEGYVGIYCCARGGRSSFYVDNVELKRRPVCPQWLHKSVYTYADSARLSWSVSPSIAPIQNYHLTLTGGGVTQLFRTSDTSVVLPNLFPLTTYR